MTYRVLITGASGFIGHHIVKEALKNNFEVFAAVRKTSDISHLKNFSIKYTYPDFSDVNSLKDDLIEKNYDYIIHAAGLTRARSQKEYNEVNAGYVYNLAQAITESGVKLKKFVLVSSLAAVGPLNTYAGAINEKTSPKPITSYGRSKLLGEDLLKKFDGIDYVILRPTGVYGPRDKDIFIFFKQLTRGIEPYIGNKDQKLSFLYVTDLAEIIVKALYSEHQKTFNLSDGNSYSRYELAGFIKEFLNIKTIKFNLPVFIVKLVATLSQGYGVLRNKAAVVNIEKINELMAANWSCDIESAKDELGFCPKYDLRYGVRETLTWYKSNNWL